MNKSILIAMVMCLVMAASAAAWYDPNLAYRKPITFSNTTHTMEPLVLNLSEVCEDDCNALFTDITIVDETANTTVAYEFLNETFGHSEWGGARAYAQAIIPDASHTYKVYYYNLTGVSDSSAWQFNVTILFPVGSGTNGWSGNGDYNESGINDGTGTGSQTYWAKADNLHTANMTVLGGDDVYHSIGVIQTFVEGTGQCRYVYDELNAANIIGWVAPEPNYISFSSAGGQYVSNFSRDENMSTWQILYWNRNYKAGTSYTEVWFPNGEVINTTDVNTFPVDEYYSYCSDNSVFKVDNIRISYQPFNQYAAPNIPSFGAQQNNTGCIPDWDCSVYATCQLNDTQVCTNVTDENTCGTPYSGDFTEFTQACDYCLPSWSCGSFGGCVANVTACLSMNDSQGCFAQTGLPADNFTFGNMSAYDVPCCTPSYACSLLGFCRTNDTQVCIGATDQTICNITYTGDFTEFGETVCDYCTPSWSCSNYGACNPGTHQKPCITVTDSFGCYLLTNLSSDNFNGNFTAYAGSCGYTGQYSTGDMKGEAVDVIGSALYEGLNWARVIIIVVMLGFVVYALGRLGLGKLGIWRMKL